VSAEWVYKTLEEIQTSDRIKREVAKSKDITLVLVPCWWDGKTDRYSIHHSLFYGNNNITSLVLWQLSND